MLVELNINFLSYCYIIVGMNYDLLAINAGYYTFNISTSLKNTI